MEELDASTEGTTTTDSGAERTTPDDQKLEASGQNAEEQDDAQLDADESNWDEKTKSYIKKLRTENKRYRTDAKTRKSEAEEARRQASTLQDGVKKLLGVGDQQLTPEQQNELLKAKLADSDFRDAVNDIAGDHGFNKDQKKYLGFLIREATQSLDDEEELSDEQMTEILSKVQVIATPGKGSSTSVTGSEGKGKQPAPGGTKEITVAQFAKMTITERSEIFTKNQGLYDSLVSAAREQGVL